MWDDSWTRVRLPSAPLTDPGSDPSGERPDFVFSDEENTEMKIRKIRPADYSSLLKLWLSCRGMGLNKRDDSREEVERFLERNPGTCFAAEEGGRIVGAVMAGNDGRRGYIYHTAVLPGCRGRGIGRALVDAAVESLREMGISKTALVVFARNEAGNAFWEKIGFHVRDDLVYRDLALAEMKRRDT